MFVFSPRGYNWHWSFVQRLHRQEPLFRDVLVECDREIQRWLGWSLDEWLARDSGSVVGSLSEEHFEPILTAVQIAQVECWRRRGMEADAVAGYSGGEFAAAYAAGALSAEEAMRVACTTSLMMKEGGAPEGGMILAEVGSEEASRLRAAMSRPVHITIESAPKSTVFGGSRKAIEALRSLLARRGVEFRELPIPFVYHVPLLDRGKAAFLRRLTPLAGSPPAIPVYSAASGGLLRDARFDAQHWYGMVTGTALVAEVTHSLLREGYDRFLSISPALGVAFPIRHIASRLRKEVVIASSLGCLVENEPPFLPQRRIRIAMISRALKRGLWHVRRWGS